MDETQEDLLKLLQQVQSEPKASSMASPQGVLDLPYYKEFLEARNTNCSFIDPNNEVYWSDVRAETDGVSLSLVEHYNNLETNEGTYFGMKEYCESIKWTHQFPIEPPDDVNLSCPKVLPAHSTLLCPLSCGQRVSSLQSPHCTLKTIQIMREIIESPVHNADGSGAMLVIRIPSCGAC
ncbi:hypothetical protein OS493_000864 [Desmophyllum pertusum]|uniref:GREB1-like circularly permuted SF2 helicase domain-containing protein n=1 Tax=Desmophyllum pertusum TaxID=174260 RepID=A0A9W9ZUV9_9CNID|nr:hypothetical protein OS493_000864 [Desmophyllum pertusum]